MDTESQPAAPTAAELRAQLSERMPAIIARLRELVAIESIAWPSMDPANVEASARRVAELAADAGFEQVEVLRGKNPDGTDGYPAVVARRPAPAGRPTVVLYAHHDVQPTGSPEDWDSEPFEAVVRGDRLFGRGAADDKAGIMVHLAALELLGDRLDCGVVLFAEGEEEAGSPSFSDFIHRYRDRLAGDVIVVADSGNWAPGVPALTSSLRGMAALEFTVRTLDHAVHSGMYGGVVPDAALAMTRLLATLHGPDGSVAVAGLGGSHEVEVDYDEAQVRTDSGVLDSTELIGTGPLSSRVWTQPSITVIGLDIPAVDSSSNTLQAAMRAKVSVRVAPGEDPAAALEALRRHLSAHVPFGATLTFGPSEAGSPWRADPSDPVVGLAREALTDGFGAPCELTGLGGSIPFIADLLEVFPGASILVTGVEDPDSRAHSANESLYLPDFESAIVSEALLLARLGAQPAAAGGQEPGRPR
ncbi:dipeptidase [Brevibacterium sp. BRM-1]|uniref:dipeptidase n=1 Tax=Brevibacterium sp. BRM-1 TaxID=2999062 RepID=UPI002280EBCD|nr:dipeptidase [Brevibacterium sp. BRM-1]WAL40735.1 dipeptidase [Brevibacterium sp. BRM-1]